MDGGMGFMWRLFGKTRIAILFAFCSVTSVLEGQKTPYNPPPGMPDGTWIYVVDTPTFQRKWALPIPEWMVTRITQELAPFINSKISQRALDRTFAKIAPVCPRDTRYRIINGAIYRYGPDPYGFGDYYLRGVVHCASLEGVPDFPNVDFIFHQGDGIPIAPGFFHPPYFWVTEDFKDQAPILSYARSKDAHYIISIPDRFTIPASAWSKLIPAILHQNEQIPWEKKIKKAFWRGTTTDFRRHAIGAYTLQEVEEIYSSRARWILCDFSLKRPDLVDAGFNVVHDPAVNLATFVRPMMKEGVSPAGHLNYAYLPVLDGYTSTFPGYLWRLLSNSVALKQETSDSQWFYDALKPYVHYIPIQENMEDLEQVILWARDHDEECQQISANARKFVLENLMMEDLYLYQLLVFLEYAKYQDFDLQDLLEETTNDSKWIRIR